MNDPQLQSVFARYDRYVDGYSASGGLEPMLELKLGHSRRVAANCRSIASDLGWPDGDLNAAEAMGLLHDVGRFPQYRRHRTFHDADSVNHAELGHQVTLDERLLSGCDPHDERRVLDGIRLHNCRFLPAGLAGGSLAFVQLARDSDKLDIFHVIREAVETGRIRNHPEILLRITLDGPANPAIIEDIRQGRTGAYGDVKSLTDFNLMQLSWFADINFVPTFRLIDARGFMGHFRRVLPGEPDVQEALERAEAILRCACGPSEPPAARITPP
jgi:hypothetical protein